MIVSRRKLKYQAFARDQGLLAFDNIHAKAKRCTCICVEVYFLWNLQDRIASLSPKGN